MKPTHAWILLGGIGLLLAAGCKPSSDAPPAPPTVEYDVGPALTLKTAGQTVHIDPDGVTSGTVVEFSPDVPLIAEQTNTLAVTASDSRFTVSESPAPFAEVEQFYLDQLAADNWKIESHRTSGSSCAIAASSGNRRLRVMLDEADSGTMITLSEGANSDRRTP